jgi:hypothetical protein
VGKKALFLDENCLFFSQSAICDQKTAHFFHKNALLKKGHDQKMFGPLFLDSVYFSESKTTFGRLILKLTKRKNECKSGETLRRLSLYIILVSKYRGFPSQPPRRTSANFPPIFKRATRALNRCISQNSQNSRVDRKSLKTQV